MTPTKSSSNKFTRFIASKPVQFLNKLGLNDKILKIIFLAGLLTFALSIFFFKFEILSFLNTQELARLEAVTNLREFLKNPADPIQGFLQWGSLKLLPNHHIFALRAPSAILITLIFSMSAVILYLKFRNRYLPYTFVLLSISSPWVILLTHQGYIAGIDTLFLLTTFIFSYSILSNSELKQKWRKYAYLLLTVSAGLLTIQAFGPFYLVFFSIFIFKSKIIRGFISTLNKTEKVLYISPLFLLPLLNILFLVINIETWKLISGYSLVDQPSVILNNLLFNVGSIFDINQNQAKGLSIGTERLDFLLIGALSLTVYEIFKKRIGRKELVLGFIISLLISAIFAEPTSIIFVIPFTIAILSLALANMIRIIDGAFPINPYPRNIARSAMLILISIITILNIYTFITATARANTPNDINQIIINRQKVVE